MGDAKRRSRMRGGAAAVKSGIAIGEEMRRPMSDDERRSCSTSGHDKLAKEIKATASAGAFFISAVPNQDVEREVWLAKSVGKS